MGSLGEEHQGWRLPFLDPGFPDLADTIFIPAYYQDSSKSKKEMDKV